MPIKMKELPETERPYEKLEQYGEKALTNAELLAIIIKTGTRTETSVGLAQQILKLNDKQKTEDLSFLREITIEELTKIRGIGKIKAIQIKAASELATRINTSLNFKTQKITQPKDVAEILMDKLRFEKQEILKVVILDNQNNLLKIKDIAKGSGNSTVALIKAIFNEAVRIQAAQIILVHNHPSGEPTPSKADIEFTKKVKSSGEILGIRLTDHIIIGKMNYISMNAKGMMEST